MKTTILIKELSKKSPSCYKIVDLKELKGELRSDDDIIEIIYNGKSFLRLRKNCAKYGLCQESHSDIKTKFQVLNFVATQVAFGHQVVSASLGNGGAGLDVSLLDITEDLESMNFDGVVEPCEDIKGWLGYDASLYKTYQFSHDNGFKVQVLTW